MSSQDLCIPSAYNAHKRKAMLLMTSARLPSEGTIELSVIEFHARKLFRLQKLYNLSEPSKISTVAIIDNTIILAMSLSEYFFTDCMNDYRGRQDINTYSLSRPSRLTVRIINSASRFWFRKAESPTRLIRRLSSIGSAGKRV